MRNANKLSKQKRFANAAAVLNEGRQHYPSEPSLAGECAAALLAYAQTVDASFKNKLLHQAEAVATRAIELVEEEASKKYPQDIHALDGKKSRYYAIRAMIALEQGHEHKAKGDANQAVELVPESGLDYEIQAKFRLFKGDNEGALHYAFAGVKKHPDSRILKHLYDEVALRVIEEREQQRDTPNTQIVSKEALKGRIRKKGNAME